MIIPDKLVQVLGHEGVVGIATQGTDRPHLVNTWNSYVKITKEGSLIIPAGGMNTTEKNIEKNRQVEVTVGSREVEGTHGPGTGFSISGRADLLKQGRDFDELHDKFPWARAALEIKIDRITQTL
jgi:hypothetical protein